MDKKSLRKEMIQSRNQLSEEEIKINSEIITSSLLNLDIYKKASFIMTYVDFKSEVKTDLIIKHSLSVGKRIGVPMTIPEHKEMFISELKDYENELELGNYNILEPKKAFIRQIHPELIDLILVPGVAFDRRGYRIGYGGGYYDRFFKKIRKKTIKLALGFEIQIIDKVPEGIFDLPVNYILTENELIDCSPKKF